MFLFSLLFFILWNPIKVILVFIGFLFIFFINLLRNFMFFYIFLPVLLLVTGVLLLLRYLIRFRGNLFKKRSLIFFIFLFLSKVYFLFFFFSFFLSFFQSVTLIFIFMIRGFFLLIIFFMNMIIDDKNAIRCL